MKALRVRLPTLLTVLLCACSGPSTVPSTLQHPSSDAGVDALGADVVVAPDVTAPTDAGTMVSVPNTLAGAQLAWVLGEINGTAGALDEATVNAHFDAGFLAAAPYAEIVSVFMQIESMFAPVTLVTIEAGASDTALIADVVNGAGEYLRIEIATDATAPGLIAGLLLQPDPSVDPTLGSWSAFDTRFGAVAPNAHMMAAEITSGVCVPIHAVMPTVEGPLGSEFKLYVLATLASQVEAGTRAWTDLLAIQDDWKSLPSGTWQNLPDGTTHTLQEFATEMISVSDNTAADHLLHTVGATNVEAMLTATGHAMPSLDDPFLTTRELFQLKLSVTSAQQQMFIADDASARAAFLTSTVDPMSLTAAAAAAPSWTSPILIDQLEWFASPTDICNVMLHLKALADATNGAPVYSVLAVNPGLSVNTGVFPYVGYKGGSEPGVLTMSWLLRRTDNRWFVVSTAFSDPNNPIDENSAEYLALAAIDLVGLD